jgi:RNase P subunit RPR2
MRVICPECRSVVYYKEKDIHLIGDMEGEYSYCVKCPECNNHIRVL